MCLWIGAYLQTPVIISVISCLILLLSQWQVYRTSQLTNCGLVTPYGDIDLDQHWLGKWRVAWWHQAITWTSVDLSPVCFIGNHLRAVSQEIHHSPVDYTTLKTTYIFLFKSYRGQWVNVHMFLLRSICGTYITFLGGIWTTFTITKLRQNVTENETCAYFCTMFQRWASADQSRGFCSLRQYVSLV